MRVRTESTVPQSASFSDAAAGILHLPTRRRLANRKALLAAVIATVVTLLIVVIAGRMVEPLAMQTDFTAKNLAPCLAHPFGTDWMGRDMFLRTIAGLSTSIIIGLLAAGVSSLLALALGAIAALGGPKADAVITWLVDLMMGIPHIVLLILISYACGKGVLGVTVGVALTHWPNLTRVIRAEILQLKESDFVAQAQHLGASRLQIARNHMLPYVLPQFIVGLVLMFPHAILHEASVTFLGFGLSPDVPAIGIILSESMRYLTAGMWWLAIFPGIALVACVILFDVAGSSLRKLVDPNSAQE